MGRPRKYGSMTVAAGKKMASILHKSEKLQARLIGEIQALDDRMNVEDKIHDRISNTYVKYKVKVEKVEKILEKYKLLEKKWMKKVDKHFEVMGDLLVKKEEKQSLLDEELDTLEGTWECYGDYCNEYEMGRQ